jgi:hypothetical protein
VGGQEGTFASLANPENGDARALGNEAVAHGTSDRRKQDSVKAPEADAVGGVRIEGSKSGRFEIR